mmetsp:Transcript_70946/g.229694  ORF Transcript_70946/g.229694 Transcript_70946/m.229694 type:complete len:207 (-) Transcript_70946:345-965(-)
MLSKPTSSSWILRSRCKHSLLEMSPPTLPCISARTARPQHTCGLFSPCCCSAASTNLLSFCTSVRFLLARSALMDRKTSRTSMFLFMFLLPNARSAALHVTNMFRKRATASSSDACWLPLPAVKPLSRLATTSSSRPLSGWPWSKSLACLRIAACCFESPCLAAKSARSTKVQGSPCILLRCSWISRARSSARGSCGSISKLSNTA